MTPLDGVPRISPSRQWGPLALVVALLLGAGAIATVKGRGPSATTTTEAGSSENQDVAKTWADNPVLPITYAEAKKAGTADQYDWGERCDTKTGRLKIPSVYSPPCTPVWQGSKPWKDKGGKTVSDNGGATFPGVTADTINVVYYQPSPQDLFSTASALGVLDDAKTMAEQFQKVVEMNNQLYELYGRKVKLTVYQGTSNGTDPTAARADAIKVATDLKAFASIGGPSQTSAYADELAARHVLCIACGAAVPDSAFQKNAPYMWGTFPTPEQFVTSVFNFGTANLWNKPARFAGDPAMRDKDRVFGVVYYEQNPPVFNGVREQTLKHFESQGYHAKTILTYLLSMNTLNQQAQTIVGKLKADGVTSVVFLGDPLMPMYLTQQATKQDYHPEWIITGTVFTDTTAAARLYDQAQWAHAFGTSSMPARSTPDLADPWRVYKWFFGTDPIAKKSEQFLGPMAQELFIGLHMAGPRLTPETFAGGMFRYPPSGGDPADPQISFGFHDQFPTADYVGPDDFTIVWWDAKVKGPDEQGKEGTGMWAYVDGGARYKLGDEPPKVGDSVLFDPKGAVTLFDELPEASRPPEYPAWPGSPAAKKAGN